MKKHLKASVEKRLRSDEAVGAFLSGGIDSTLVTSMMAEISSKKIKTFSIGFSEGEFNEAPVAKSLADYLKTEHFEKIISPQDLLSEVDKIFDYYDEPFADSSQIAVSILSEFSQPHARVVLSGDGADELFFGYDSISNVCYF